MGKVFVDLSMPLDGFIAGPNDSIEHPLGEGGERLHDWVFGGKPERSGSSPRNSASGVNREVMDEAFQSMGAIVMGRRWFDIGEMPWGDDPPFRVPVFVLTHHARETISKGATIFTFITDGLQSGLERAQAAAGARDVSVGAADVAQQCIRAGLLDEIHLHLVPILLGEGVRLFDHLGPQPIELERTKTIDAPGVTHLSFRIAR